MNKEIISIALALGCVSSIAATNNYDLLGRKGSKMNSPMVYRNVDYSKVEKNEQQKLNSSLENRSLAKMASGIKGGAKAIVGKFSPKTKGYAFTDCSKKTKGCGESLLLGSSNLTWSEYLNRVNSNFININSQEKDRLSTSFNYVSAGPTRCNSSNSTMTEFPYPGSMTLVSPYDAAQYITYKPGSDVNNRLGRSYDSRTNVGVYLSGSAAPVRLNEQSDLKNSKGSAPFIVADNGSINSFVKKPDDEMLAARMYKIVHWYSDQSSVFITRSRPSNPAGENPQIYMGLHGDNAAGSYSYYPTKAKDLDNYIYDKRTVEIVAAGNHASGKFSHKGQTVNAITVGALDPITNNPTSYSAHIYPMYSQSSGDIYRKPEIYNYSNFYLDDYYRKYEGVKNYEFKPAYSGTETAAAVTAGMISNMLSYNEFYKWHPEVVKSVVLNSDNRFPKYNDLVFDQTDKKHLHHSYYFIGDVNTLMNEYRGPISDQSEIHIWDNRKEIRLSGSLSQLMQPFNLSSYTCVDGFHASIAWLNSGNDIVNLGTIPQNFEIETFWVNDIQSKRIYDSSVNAARADGTKNPYKTVSFKRQTSSYSDRFVISIVLTDEDSRSENYGQMVLGLDIKPIYKCND